MRNPIDESSRRLQSSFKLLRYGFSGSSGLSRSRVGAISYTQTPKQGLIKAKREGKKEIEVCGLRLYEEVKGGEEGKGVVGDGAEGAAGGCGRAEGARIEAG